MTFNLLNDPFLPVVMRSGDRKWLAFFDLMPSDEDDYPVEFCWPRPDFNIASFEFCIGVLSLALNIRDEDEWQEGWDSPPSQDELAAKLAPFVHAFDLNGEGPRFLQDHDSLQGAETPIEFLLIDTPGQNGQRKNSDLLTHRDRYAALGLPAAATALYTLQAYAPSGGAGNRTSMRGGGPLTALVIPAVHDGEPPLSLWRKIYANVGHCKKPTEAERPQALPWLAPTITSEKGRTVSAAGAHPLQAYFGMPRRIRLVFASEPGVCSMTGCEGPLVTGFIQKPYGVNYGTWIHPLTPYRRQKEEEEPYSAKPKSGRFGYRDWVATTVSNKESKLAEQPENENIKLVRERYHLFRQSEQAADARVRVGGWAMNNMEAVAYLFAEQPLHIAQTPEQQQKLDDTAQRFSKAADIAASQLREALKKARPSAQNLDQARTDFFDATEDLFHHLLDDLLREMPADDSLAPAREWLKIMRRTALAIFDRLAPVPLQDAVKAKDIVQAYGILSATFAGQTKQSTALYSALELPRPQKNPTLKRRILNAV